MTTVWNITRQRKGTGCGSTQHTGCLSREICRPQKASEPLTEGCCDGGIIPWHIWFATHESKRAVVAPQGSRPRVVGVSNRRAAGRDEMGYKTEGKNEELHQQWSKRTRRGVTGQKGWEVRGPLGRSNV